jgi:beta-galactosidase
VRTFRFDAERGFILNDKPYPIRGANLMHSARPEKGTAVTRDEIAEDFAILREMGSTGVRLVHFQHPSASLEEADRLGLAAWTEIGINSEVEDTPAFRTNAARQMRELIAQGYNHPSVVLWGVGNEVYSEDPKVARVLGALHALAKKADPTRATVYAHCCQGDDHPKAMVTDVIGFNRYFGWYADQSGNTLGKWAERFHAQQPSRPFAVSEYGAGASIRHQADPPGPVDPPSGWHPEQYQTEYHERNWAELRDKPYIWGTFVWVAFDLHSAGRHEGDTRGINDKGLVTLDRRTRKDAWYWYQANWSDRPVLHITNRRFAVRDRSEVEVKVFTNAGSASLWLNGVPVGTQAVANRTARWRVQLREGANRIEVRGPGGLADAVEWFYRPAPGMLDADAAPLPPS